MKKIAYRELSDALIDMKYGTPFQNVDSFIKELNGPIIDTTNKKYVTFEWYKELEWGDTASIYVDVYKNLSSFSWRDNYFWPRITMNYQWSYLYGPKSEFKDILPYNYEDNKLILSSLQLYENQEKCYQNFDLLIKLDRLFFFIKKGYFEVIEKGDDYTIVSFYQPIFKIFLQVQGKTDTITTMGAKIIINKIPEIIILPYNTSL